jgi:hypothetical protein
MLCNESHLFPEGVQSATDHSHYYMNVSIASFNANG